MVSNKIAIGIILTIVGYWIVVLSFPALREFHDFSQIGVSNDERCRAFCQVARWWKKKEDFDWDGGDNVRDWIAETPISVTSHSPSKAATTATTTTTKTTTPYSPRNYTLENLMDMGFPEEMAREIYQSLRDSPVLRTRVVDTPRLTTRITGWLKSFFETLIYLGYVLAGLFSCVAAILWCTGGHTRATNWQRRFRKYSNFITGSFMRVWDWLQEKRSQLHDDLAFCITFSRLFLTHHLKRTGHFILKTGVVITTISLSPYLLYRILFFFFLKAPHERENNGGFDGAFAIAIHVIIDHPYRVILATLITLWCLARLMGTNDKSNPECYRCLREKKNVSMETVDVGKLCQKHRAAEDKQRKRYRKLRVHKEREMMRKRCSPEVASTLPSGEQFAPVPWHPLPLYDFSSIFSETEAVEESQEISSYETAQSTHSGYMGGFGISEWERSPSFASTPSMSKSGKERFL
ncbi:MAG: hypothetical protein L6R37_006067 [Teloschistes peruensis]|nr:MAG: hypothetical protein L6R37_006067 [Teloschistes peruensis]